MLYNDSYDLYYYRNFIVISFTAKDIMEMKENNLITVIVPVYNAEEKIERCVTSIRSQTYYNLEIILVDDGSTDNSIEKCRELADSDNRIKLVHQDNLGPGAARNAGISIADGALIAFVDADDFLEVNMYEEMVSKQNKYDSDITICGTIEHYENGNIKYKNFISEECREYQNEPYIGLITKYKTDVLIGAVWNKLYKKDLLCDIWMDTDTTYAEDFMFNIALARKAESIYIMEQCLYNYCREDETSLSRKPKDINDYITKILRTCLYYKNMFPENRWKKSVVDFYEHELLSVLAVIFIADLSKEEQKNYFLKIRDLDLFKEITVNKCRNLEIHLLYKGYWNLLFAVGQKYRYKQRIKKFLKNRRKI